MGIILSSPLIDPSGYGQAGRDYMKALYDAGIDVLAHIVRYYNGNSNELLTEFDLNLIRELDITKRTDLDFQHYNVIHHATPNVPIYPAFAKCKRKMMYSVWETNRIPDEFKNSFNNYETIFTASDFSKNAFLETCPDLNVKVIPHIIHNYDTFNIRPNSAIQKYKKEGKIVFFASLEWHIGKGYDVLLKGFCEAFKNRDDVILVLKTYDLANKYYKDKILSYIKEQKKSEYPKIIPFIGNARWQDLLSLYKTADCYISMSRREAFGLTMAEAFGFRVPIICPDKGGHREFLSSDNAMLINSSYKPVTNLETDRSLYIGQKWVEPNLDDFIETLKKFYKKREYLTDTLMIQRDHDITKFSPKRIVKKFVKYIL